MSRERALSRTLLPRLTRLPTTRHHAKRQLPPSKLRVCSPTANQELRKVCSLYTEKGETPKIAQQMSECSGNGHSNRPVPCGCHTPARASCAQSARRHCASHRTRSTPGQSEAEPLLSASPPQMHLPAQGFGSLPAYTFASLPARSPSNLPASSSPPHADLTDCSSNARTCQRSAPDSCRSTSRRPPNFPKASPCAKSTPNTEHRNRTRTQSTIRTSRSQSEPESSATAC